MTIDNQIKEMAERFKLDPETLQRVSTACAQIMKEKDVTPDVAMGIYKKNTERMHKMFLESPEFRKYMFERVREKLGK